MEPTDRSNYEAKDIISDIWTGLSLPTPALQYELTGNGKGLLSSYKLGHVAQASIALSALAASHIRSRRLQCDIAPVRVDLEHACIEFHSEAQYVLNKQPTPGLWSPISGTYETSDGHIGIHANFENHRLGAFKVLGLPNNSGKKAVVEAVKRRRALDLEDKAHENKCVMYALRSLNEWERTPQAKAVRPFPITVRKICDGPRLELSKPGKCLEGLRVAEMSRVIAAPVAGRTLAAHGADVLWIHGPHLPSLPDLDIDTSRGKRSTFIDLPNESSKLRDLLSTAHVFLQSFRPNALASRGFSSQEVASMNPNGVIYASLSAFGEDGPWSDRRGFDSMVQLCTGIDASEGECFGLPLKKWPVQALDHAAGYFLVVGILAALDRKMSEGGSYEVHVSLAGVAEFIKSLGRYEGQTGFEHVTHDVEKYLESRQCAFGNLKAVRHAGEVEGVEVGWERMPERLGSSEAVWL